MNNELWHTARRILGVYFVITGAIYLPTAITVLGFETSSISRWPIVVIPLIQGGIALAAGGWLLSGAAIAQADTRAGAWNGALITILQLLGLYFVVEGVAAATEPAVNMFFFGEAWQVRVGSLASAAVTLLAGVVLVARPSTVAKKIAELSETPA
jgi:hypothetical protein